MSLSKKLSEYSLRWSSLPPSRQIELLTLAHKLSLAIGVVAVIALLVYGCS
jgi:hypothetical protein